MYSTVMYESKPYEFRIPEDALGAMAEAARSLELRSCLIWSEHCTECVWPSCYTTCSLYTPRSDLKCRRFIRGIEPVKDHSGFAVSFRTWGKLEAVGPARLSKLSSRRRQETFDHFVAQTLDGFPAPFGPKVALTNSWNRLKTKFWAGSEPIGSGDAFAIECVSLTPNRNVNFYLRIFNSSKEDVYYESHFCLRPGYNFLTFEVDQISNIIDLSETVKVQIEPIDHSSGNHFIFTLLDFGRMREWQSPVIVRRLSEASPSGASDLSISKGSRQTTTPPKVKCVVWDLDNTIWSGTLIEDGPEGIELRAEILQIVVELDRRGILQSVASKNDQNEAEDVLKRFGLMDYFVFPQIHWYPKSQSISQIAKLLNINEDTFVFIDDQLFEREEVRSAHPTVRVVDATNLAPLLDRADFDVPVTAESRRRRRMYKEEEQRTAEFNKSNVNFLEFLRASKLKLIIRGLEDETMERAFELTQRTNQLNYGGRQLSKSDLEEIATLSSSRRGLVIGCSDRFGDYGVVGFAVVNISNWTIEDFFMSCRVQHKKVENALMAHLVKLGKSHGSDTIRVRYRQSKRNGPALHTLTEMEFARVTNSDDVIFLPPVQVPHSDLVEIEDSEGWLH